MKKSLPVAVVLAFSCAAPSWAHEPPLHVVASFSVLGDMVRNVGGDLIDVKTLVGANGDAHGYQPTPDDLKAVAKADLVFVNGLGIDGWMDRLVDAAGYKGTIIVATTGIKTRTMVEGDDKAAPKTVTDPHAWQDLSNGVIYAHNIAVGLAAALPTQSKVIEERSHEYENAITAMDQEVRASIAAVPVAERVVITSHDAFGYFGAAYGVRFFAPYGLSTESEPSAAGIAGLIDQIKVAGVHEVFIENMSNPRLVAQLAKDAGAQLGGTLYSDALSAPNEAAPSYLAMFKNNVPKLKAAMLATHAVQ
jgi:zinc/manganese transport system substrate-binding protein